MSWGRRLAVVVSLLVLAGWLGWAIINLSPWVLYGAAVTVGLVGICVELIPSRDEFDLCDQTAHISGDSVICMLALDHEGPHVDANGATWVPINEPALGSV